MLATPPGSCAGMIDIGARWMSDLKEGVCVEAFWFNKEQCCWSGDSTTFDEEGDCDQVWYMAKCLLLSKRYHLRTSPCCHLRASPDTKKVIPNSCHSLQQEQMRQINRILTGIMELIIFRWSASLRSFFPYSLTLLSPCVCACGCMCVIE